MIDYSIEEIRTKRKLAYFYCDKCGNYLGTTLEKENGYLPRPATCYFMDSIFLEICGHKIITLPQDFDEEIILCKDCYNNFVDFCNNQLNIIIANLKTSIKENNL